MRDSWEKPAFILVEVNSECTSYAGTLADDANDDQQSRRDVGGSPRASSEDSPELTAIASTVA
jgi:hypothetical protein